MGVDIDIIDDIMHESDMIRKKNIERLRSSDAVSFMINKVQECAVRDALVSHIGGKKEVRTPSGDIDILTECQVIEVKYFRSWKSGVGQVLAYGLHFPLLTKRLHLFAHKGELVSVMFTILNVLYVQQAQHVFSRVFQ